MKKHDMHMTNYIDNIVIEKKYYFKSFTIFILKNYKTRIFIVNGVFNVNTDFKKENFIENYFQNKIHKEKINNVNNISVDSIYCKFKDIISSNRNVNRSLMLYCFKFSMIGDKYCSLINGEKHVNFKKTLKSTINKNFSSGIDIFDSYWFKKWIMKKSYY
jgi:hypothetical protein